LDLEVFDYAEQNENIKSKKNFLTSASNSRWSHGCSLKDEQGDYEQSIWYHEKALAIQQKILPSSHPSLATSYNNIVWVFRSMDNYLQALLYLERALNIRQRSLPVNHPSIQDVRENIDIVNRELVKCVR
jgi:tetratricopeptide (TPR) repeat protein